MPERVTPEERLVSLAIEKARVPPKFLDNVNRPAKEVEHEAEDAKLKRPKAENDKTMIQTQSEEGYGLAGQEMKIGRLNLVVRLENSGVPPHGGTLGLLGMMKHHLENLSKSPDTKDNYDVKE